MTRKEQIKSAYKLTGRNAGFYMARIRPPRMMDTSRTMIQKMAQEIHYLERWLSDETGL